jgi:hypothetical protein
MAPVNLSPVQQLLAALHRAVETIINLIPSPPVPVKFDTAQSVSVTNTATVTFGSTTQPIRIATSDVSFTTIGADDAQFNQAFGSRVL